MPFVQLTMGQVARVDASDLAALSRHKWMALRRKTGGFYAITNRPRSAGRPRIMLMHRMLLGVNGPWIVDHKNHDTLDNRRRNLRKCDKSQNAANRRGLDANNTSGARGVALSRSGKRFVARIHVRGTQIYLGSFETLRKAAQAYKDANQAYFGEFGGRV